MTSLRAFKILAAVAVVGLLAACGYNASVADSGGSGSPPPAPNSVVATTSGTTQVAVGSSAAVSVTFTTNDGTPATGLSVTGGLSPLPAGWTGPASFSCASVSSGSGCMLTFAYKPTAIASGSFTVSYGYTNNAGAAKTGTVAVNFASTNHNNVIATATPTGQIAVIVGARQTVSVAFTTDDGRNATALSASAAPLPAGWSAPAGTFTCATVNAGSGCTLNLTFAPTTTGSGTVTVNFTYVDGSGTARTGAIAIPYAATTQNNVVATQTPAGQIALLIGASQTVKIDFTTDDMNPVTGLSITPANLTSLPSGWTGPATFTCATVTTGNGCELALDFHPTQPGSGTITLNFAYTNNSGTAKTGTVNIAYIAGSDNTIVGTPSPSGTIDAVVGTGSQTVTVTFNSSDGNPGSNLSVTGGLSPLPAGWSGPATFTCASANTGNACQLTLTYTPLTADSGTLQLQFGYNASSGAAKSGTVSIPYVATTSDNLVATVSPTGSISAVVNSPSTPVTVTFTTDDGNPATAIAITSGLATLPAGWTGPATFTCATASIGTGCQLTLNYAPTVNGSGTVSLGYSYDDDSGAPKTGTVNIDYASKPGFIYITDTNGQVLRCAISGADGSLSACSPAATGFTASFGAGIAFSGNWAYVSPGAVATDVDVCPVAADGTLGACASAHTFGTPTALAVSGGRLYVADANGPGYVHSCDINNLDGTLGNCVDNAVGAINTMDGVTVTATTAYIVDINGDNLTTCAVSPTNGTLSACSQQTLGGTTPAGGNTPVASPRSVSAYGGNLYVGTGAGVLQLPIQPDGSVIVMYPCPYAAGPGVTCVDDLPPLQTPMTGFAFNNGYAYVAGFGNSGNGGVGVCKVEASGYLDNCITGTSPGTPAVYGGLAVH